MDLIKQIQNDIKEKADLKEQETQELLHWIEEENEKISTSLGIEEAFGERAAAARAGEREWVQGMSRDQQDPLQAPEVKPIFLMGKQVPPRAVTITKDGRAIIRAKGRTFEYEVDDQGDKIVLR